MAELALYRKYRPHTFADVIGQESIVRVLTTAVKDKTISHAYLFSGSRGTGKTSVARILAQAIGTVSEDLYEIDAASNRGIDEIRELRDGVATLPFRSPRKVYIIDEVHMLTKEAFNALLKTLEEPPAHVMFILATTEFHKLPETIISRCQHFVFKKPSQEVLESHLTTIAKKEGYKLETEAAELLALLGDGSYRDALSALEKAINVSKDKKIIRSEIEVVTGAPKVELVQAIITSILDHQLDSGLRAIREAASDNYDFQLFLKLILRELRLAMLGRFGNFPLSDYPYALKISKHESASRLPEVLRELLSAYDNLRRTYLPELSLELALIKLHTAVQS